MGGFVDAVDGLLNSRLDSSEASNVDETGEGGAASFLDRGFTRCNRKGNLLEFFISHVIINVKRELAMSVVYHIIEAVVPRTSASTSLSEIANGRPSMIDTCLSKQ